MQEALKRSGLLCSSCGLTMEDGGWHYINIHAQVRGGQPVMTTSMAFICDRPGCDEARDDLDEKHLAKRRWEAWTYLVLEPDGWEGTNNEEDPSTSNGQPDGD